MHKQNIRCFYDFLSESKSACTLPTGETSECTRILLCEPIRSYIRANDHRSPAVTELVNYYRICPQGQVTFIKLHIKNFFNFDFSLGSRLLSKINFHIIEITRNDHTTSRSVINYSEPKFA